MPSFKKSLIVEQFQGNYLKPSEIEIMLLHCTFGGRFQERFSLIGTSCRKDNRFFFFQQKLRATK